VRHADVVRLFDSFAKFPIGRLGGYCKTHPTLCMRSMLVICNRKSIVWPVCHYVSRVMSFKTNGKSSKLMPRALRNKHQRVLSHIRYSVIQCLLLSTHTHQRTRLGIVYTHLHINFLFFKQKLLSRKGGIGSLIHRVNNLHPTGWVIHKHSRKCSCIIWRSLSLSSRSEHSPRKSLSPACSV
jgi:hypothetical protein